MRLANVPRRSAGRILIRCVAFLFALLLLQVLLSCKGPDFTGGALEKDCFTTLKTFCVDSQPDPALCIWNMRPIPFEELKPLVSDRLKEKGYRLTLPQEADARISLTTFTEESSPRRRIAVLEIFERSSSRRLWSGYAEIPYRIDPRQGVTNQPALRGLLELIPARMGPDHNSSRRNGSSGSIARQMDVHGPLNRLYP